MSEGVRLDKWLWAARFFKTRSLAQQAVTGGRVEVNGQAARASRQLRTGDQLNITRGELRFEVIVEQLLDRRGSAPQARAMYRETEAGRVAREQQLEQRRLLRAAGPAAPEHAPDKRDRRRLRELGRKQ